MKILAFADVHAQQEILQTLVKKADKVDVLLCAGDLSFFGNGLARSVKTLTSSGKKILIVPGNHETEKDIAILAKNNPLVIPLHQRVYEFLDYLFFGYGLGGFSTHEPGMEKFMRQLHLPADKKRIFVTHAPPYNTALDYLPWLDDHRGCKTAVSLIKKFKPQLAFCGHFHETAGKSCFIGKTHIINPGWKGKIVEI